MDVALVSNVIFPFVTGGAEKRIHEIATRLSQRGHDVTIYGRHFWDGPKETSHEGVTLRAVAPETDLYTDDRRSITEALDFAARLAYPLAKQLRDENHDLVVASVFPYFPVLSAKLAALGTDVPVVTTWHEVWGDYWDDYLGVLAPFGKFTEHLTVRVPQHPIAVSGITADRLADTGRDRDTIEVVPNGIDVDQIRNAPLPDEGDSFDVLFAGRLIADKNVSVLLDAFDRVADDYDDVTLGVVGDGPEADRLEQQASTLDHANRVSLLGFLDEYEDVLGQMRAADVFASPSTREGFGITYAEAMAADCTVIGVQHPESAASEVIGDAGYLAEPTVDSVTESLDRALTGETPPTEPTKRAEEYDWDSVADQAEAAYERAINGGW